MPIVEKDEYDFLLHSAKFCDAIDNYSSLLAINQTELELYKNESELFHYVFTHKPSYGLLADSFMKHKTSYIQMHFYNLVSQCKSSCNYTNRIGEELGISAITPLQDPATSTPDLSLDFTAAGYPVLKWKKGIFEGVEIWKDCGDGCGYRKLGHSYKSQYTDTSPLPDNKAEVWKYSAIYLFKDEVVGNWSDEREVIVHGYI